MLAFVRFAMTRSVLRVAALVATITLSFAVVHAQSAGSDANAAARELISTMKLDQQFKALLPTILQSIKPAIVQNRPDVDRDFDAFAPQLQSGFENRLGELIEAVVMIYASNFTADELRAATAFYRTPTGQTFLQKTPLLAQQTMAAGQKFGQSVGAEVQQRMIQDMRN